ncbi:PLP-binding barrel [Venustampulla echinocandica]|uniref:Pyridoxal phosphate homeostasis protein n=1 Tax=Venustampulla echinocandica TaxID=2656787 RepID=A0A370TVB0_9HELO|nr:PLP-binding barrel [Venustampulla echinocandica]RDL39408.1 PLP-binding barrel [Venustampulla echinocandica]
MSDNHEDQPNMKIDPARAASLAASLQSVSQRVVKAANGRNVRTVAVSKLKPAADILALYQEAKQEHFGENYAQELMEKAEMLPKDIKWHFIGGLQSNKCKPLTTAISNLWCVSSVDSEKKATQLSLGRSTHTSLAPLNIHIQVNTSGEAAKSGATPGSETTTLAKHVLSTCPHLNLLGLMTIGAIARSKEMKAGEENEDFRILKEERDRLETELKEELGGRKLELSMGMSEDFEGAIMMGSDEVRVGSTIFGERPKKEEFTVK